MSPRASRSPRAASCRAPALPIPVAQPSTSVRFAMAVDSDRAREKVLNSRAPGADRRHVSENPITPAAPAAGDVVEIVDRLYGPARDRGRRERERRARTCCATTARSKVPDEAQVRWFDGDTAWQAISKLASLDETSAELRARDRRRSGSRRRCAARCARPSTTRPCSSRSSARPCSPRGAACTPSASTSPTAAAGPAGRGARRSSATPSTSPGRWATGRPTAEPGWVSARVARIVALPFGARQVGFTFEIADADQAARVRAWHQSWLHEHRQRLLDQRAA